jgi:hypothetical protein
VRQSQGKNGQAPPSKGRRRVTFRSTTEHSATGFVQAIATVSRQAPQICEVKTFTVSFRPAAEADLRALYAAAAPERNEMSLFSLMQGKTQGRAKKVRAADLRNAGSGSDDAGGAPISGKISISAGFEGSARPPRPARGYVRPKNQAWSSILRASIRLRQGYGGQNSSSTRRSFSVLGKAQHEGIVCAMTDSAAPRRPVHAVSSSGPWGGRRPSG